MIKATVEENGFEGLLFTGNGSREKVVIVMSGSNGGMKLTEQCARFYDRNGIAALAVALFATKETQPCLDRVPVEYVENAIHWLRKLGYAKIGIDAMSKGSELALVCASMFADISCVIARVPSHFVSEGLSGAGKNKTPSHTSCWSYKGEELPYAPYRIRTFDIPGLFMKYGELHIISYNADKDILPESIIPVENIKAPVLLLSSRNDTVWPSYDSAVYIENRLNESGFAYVHKHIDFEHMSHAVLTELPLLYKIAFKAERKNPQGCKQDREQLKQELLHWVNEVW